MNQPNFTMDIDHNEYLTEGARDINAGVGTDWRVAELHRVSAALLGSVDIVPDPAGLAADFSAMMAE